MSFESVIAGKYARALLLIAKQERCLEEVQRDLNLAAEIFGRGEGRSLLLHPRLSREQKEAAVKEALMGKVAPLTISLLKLLIAKRRGMLVAEIAVAYQMELQRLQGRQNATVTSVVPLSEEQTAALRARLSAIAGAEVDLIQEQDPSLRGGARVTMGDLLLDGSLGAKLEQLRKALSSERLREN